jgi:preprotein translocase subunit SecF
VDSKDFVTVIGDLPLAAKVGIGAGVIAVVALAAWLLLIRKKQKRKTEK